MKHRTQCYQSNIQYIQSLHRQSQCLVDQLLAHFHVTFIQKSIMTGSDIPAVACPGVLLFSSSSSSVCLCVCVGKGGALVPSQLEVAGIMMSERPPAAIRALTTSTLVSEPLIDTVPQLVSQIS